MRWKLACFLLIGLLVGMIMSQSGNGISKAIAQTFTVGPKVVEYAEEAEGPLNAIVGSRSETKEDKTVDVEINLRQNVRHGGGHDCKYWSVVLNGKFLSPGLYQVATKEQKAAEKKAIKAALTAKLNAKPQATPTPDAL